MEPAIYQLVNYGLSKGLMERADAIYCVNALLAIMEKEEEAGDFTVTPPALPLVQILDTLCDEAVLRDIIDGDQVSRDRFDTKLMGVLTQLPSTIQKKFREHYQKSPQAATQWYYEFSQDTNYIRRDRMRRDVKWKTATAYGDLDITINLAKPEKDPKAIAAAKKMAQSNYPKCQLCLENEGYAGRINHPARQNHRVIPVSLEGEDWYLQYSPYVYYNEHCIVFHGDHHPMKIDGGCFRKLFDFVRQFPHYFVGSNADLPIVGGSILTHEHFQGGHYSFAMEKAEVEQKTSFAGFEDVEAGILKWPMSVLRLTGKDPETLVALAETILDTWREYSDEAVNILAHTQGQPHNTITPIARRKGEDYQIDLALRNNRTTKEYPLGLFHPHAQYHHIKKENIGLIEVMGLAILPARLKEELRLVGEGLINQTDLSANPLTAKHAPWAEAMGKKYPEINGDNVEAILKKETGLVFEKVMENAGVFKSDAQGQAAFLRFIQDVNQRLLKKQPRDSMKQWRKKR